MLRPQPHCCVAVLCHLHAQEDSACREVLPGSHSNNCAALRCKLLQHIWIAKCHTCYNQCPLFLTSTTSRMSAACVLVTFAVSNDRRRLDHGAASLGVLPATEQGAIIAVYLNEEFRSCVGSSNKEAGAHIRINNIQQSPNIIPAFFFFLFSRECLKALNKPSIGVFLCVCVVLDDNDFQVYFVCSSCKSSWHLGIEKSLRRWQS